MTDTPETPKKSFLSGLTNENGLFGAVAQTKSWKEKFDLVGKNTKDTLTGVNVFNGEKGKGMRGVAFGRVAGVGAGVAIMGDSLRSKKADGEDRGAVGRIVEFLVGGGVAATALVAGKAR